MRFLLAACFVTLLSLVALSATDRPPDAGTTLTLDDYWKLVEHTRQVVTQLEGQPAATVRRELRMLADEWDRVLAVRYPDGSIVQIDSSYLLTELGRTSPQLRRLQNILEALLQAHREYPQQVFTSADVAPLKQILARPEFQWQAPPPRETPAWRKRLDGFTNRIGIEMGTFLAELDPLFRIVAILLFVLVLFFIARSLSHNLVREAELAAEESGDEEVLTSRSALKRAEGLSAHGDYRNAIRYLYLSSLLVLDEQGLLRYDRSRTNREYLQSVSSKPQLAKPLREVIDVFDRVWYGFEGVDEQTYQLYVQRVGELRGQKE